MQTTRLVIYNSALAPLATIDLPSRAMARLSKLPRVICDDPELRLMVLPFHAPNGAETLILQSADHNTDDALLDMCLYDIEGLPIIPDRKISKQIAEYAYRSMLHVPPGGTLHVVPKP